MPGQGVTLEMKTLQVKTPLSAHLRDLWKLNSHSCAWAKGMLPIAWGCCQRNASFKIHQGNCCLGKTCKQKSFWWVGGRSEEIRALNVLLKLLFSTTARGSFKKCPCPKFSADGKCNENPSRHLTARKIAIYCEEKHAVLLWAEMRNCLKAGISVRIFMLKLPENCR